MMYPKLGGGTWELTEEQVQAWQAVYYGVDVAHECASALEWLKANPDRLKKNVPRFLVNWLKRIDNEGRRVVRWDGAYREPGPRKAQPTNYAEVEKVVYARCILDGDTEEDARRIARRVVEGMKCR